jgi:hypothetical protein
VVHSDRPKHAYLHPMPDSRIRHVAQAELLKMQKIGQFPDEPVKIGGTQIHYVASQTY